MPRWAAPLITSWIATGRLISMKKSAGPPMPNDVRDPSGSSSLTAGSERSQLSLDAVRQLIAQPVDVSGAHQEQQVARADKTLEHLARHLEVADVCGARDLVRQLRSVDSRRVFLTCGVNVQHQHLVRPAERAREVVHQRRQARVAMRLENDDQATVTELSRCVDRGSDLRRVMCVVVVDGRALERAEELQTPVRPRKGFQSHHDVRERDSDLERHGGGARRVLDVVAAGLPQVDAAELVAAEVDRKWTDGLRAVSRVVAKAVRDAPRLRLELACQLIVRAYDRQPIVGQVQDEPLEELADRADVSEVIRMVELDFGEDGAPGMDHCQ